MNVAASIRDYILGLLQREDVSVFIAALQKLRSGFNEACVEAEMFAFLGVSLLTLNSLKLRVQAVCVTYIIRRTDKMVARKAFVMHFSRHNSPLVACPQV